MRRAAWVDLLTYASVAAVLVMLIRADLLRWPRIESPSALCASIAALAAGFLASAAAWRASLASGGVHVSRDEALASCGLSVFGKYLPGKVWLVLGMAGRIARRHPIDLSEAVAAATRMQVLSLWMGLTVGLPALALLHVDGLAVAAGIAMMLLGSAVLAVAPLRRRVERRLALAHRIFAYLWPRGARLTPSLLAWLAVTWLAWGIGFGLLARALGAAAGPWQLYTVFPLAGVLGLLVLIAPGGIGAREGVLALALATLGTTPELVAVIAVSSRAWFLFGELSLFAAGAWAARRLVPVDPEPGSRPPSVVR